MSIRIQNLFLATRPWSFSASFVPSVIGLILANETKKHLSGADLFISFFSVITVILVQTAGNLVNTYYDYINGIDRKVTSQKDQQPNEIKCGTGDSTLIENIITIKQLLKLLLTCYLASFITFIFVLTSSSPSSTGILILLYVLGLASSYFYTGGVSLKYKAFGDLVILVTFGPLIAEFTFASCRGYVTMSPIVISLPLAINAESILHVNNMRDIESDREAGIFTLVMLLGTRFSHVTMAILLVVPYLFCLFIAVRYACCWLFLLPCLTTGSAADIYAQVSASNYTSLPEKVAKFHLIFGTFYAIAIYFCGIGTFIGI